MPGATNTINRNEEYAYLSIIFNSIFQSFSSCNGNAYILRRTQVQSPVNFSQIFILSFRDIWSKNDISFSLLTKESNKNNIKIVQYFVCCCQDRNERTNLHLPDICGRHRTIHLDFEINKIALYLCIVVLIVSSCFDRKLWNPYIFAVKVYLFNNAFPPEKHHRKGQKICTIVVYCT